MQHVDLAWQIKTHEDHPVDGRTCKHLKELLGDAYEDARLRAKGVDPDADKKKKQTKSKGTQSSKRKSDGAASPTKKARASEPKVGHLQ